MPDKQPSSNPQPNPPTQPDATPPTQRPSGEGVEPEQPPAAPAAPRSLRGAGLRYSDNDDVPDWAKGKTADQVLQMAQQLYNTVVAGAAPTSSAPSSPTPPPQTNPITNGNAAPATAPVGVVQPPDPELMYSNSAEYQRQWDAYQAWRTQQQIEQASAPFLQSQTHMARNASRANPEYADVWSEYAPEIEALMATLPLSQRANPQMWDQAAQMVAGRHVRELSRRYAERQPTSPPDTGTVSADGVIDPAARTLPSDPIDRLFVEHPELMTKYTEAGIDANKLRLHLAKMGKNPVEWAESLVKKEVIHG